MPISDGTRYMDCACQMLIVVGAIVLFLMLFYDNFRTTPRVYPNATTSVCGSAMRASTTAAEADGDGTSAKRAGAKPGHQNGRSSNVHVIDKSDYHSIHEVWPNNDNANNDNDCHPESTQNAAVLQRLYTWDADAYTNDKFDQAKVDLKAVQKNANMRAVNKNATAAEQPRQASKLGMRSLLDGLRPNLPGLKFSQDTSWFNGSDAYFAARGIQDTHDD